MFDEEAIELNEIELSEADQEKAIREAALEKFKDRGFTYGDIVPKRWFYEPLEMTDPALANTVEHSKKLELLWMTRFYPLQDMIALECQMWLRTNNAGGYLIVDPSEQAALVQKDRDRRIASEFRKSKLWLSTINTALLNDAQRKEASDALVHNSQLVQLFRKEKRGFGK